MLFSNKRQYSSSTTNNHSLVFIHKNTQNNHFMTYATKRPQQQQQNQIQSSSVNENVNLQIKKANWGKPTWYLFHTLAEKIKEENFLQIKNELLNIINIICINLPCPICADHAKKYMQNINFNSIQTKEQLKDMLFQFHNNVNALKNYPQFPKEELDNTYSKANMSNIVQHFMFHFKDKSRNVRMISNEMYRNMVIKQVSTWLSKYNRFFNF